YAHVEILQCVFLVLVLKNFACVSYVIFFFSSRRRHTRSTRDWSSDVCSSDLAGGHDTMNVRVKIELLAPSVQDTEETDLRTEVRSEERRVGKECRSRWGRYQ